MIGLERLALQACACAVVALGAWLWHADQVHDARLAGRAEAVAAGKVRYDAEVARNRETEAGLREKLAARDLADKQKEETYAETLAAAQRRLRAGDDSLRIAVRTIRATATTPTGPAAGGPAPDESRAELVPEVAADAVGFAAAAAGIVRKFDRLEQRFDDCRALNNGAARGGGD